MSDSKERMLNKWIGVMMSRKVCFEKRQKCSKCAMPRRHGLFGGTSAHPVPDKQSLG